jgi:hypothetical protein
MPEKSGKFIDTFLKKTVAKKAIRITLNENVKIKKRDELNVGKFNRITSDELKAEIKN